MQSPTVTDIRARAFTVPTDAVEADGTLVWDSTTLVTAGASCAGMTGLGYSYTDATAVRLVNDVLAPSVRGRDPMNITACRQAMVSRVRNIGQSGLAMAAVAAVDNALWDLKAKMLGLPLVRLLGQVRERVPVYGSGGFSSYSIERLQQQLGAWAEQGFSWVKMKAGADPAADPERVAAARGAIGPRCGLFVDANWAYDRKQALAFADRFAEQGVSWFEEPVHHHDVAGLRLIRDRAPAGMDIAAGEYGTSIDYFRTMLEQRAVDVLQADATKCGISGLMQAATLCQAYHVPLSAHTAPSVHCHPCAAIMPLRHVEFFHDHVRIEQMLFDGAATAENGFIAPDVSRPGMGLELKEADARQYEI